MSSTYALHSSTSADVAKLAASAPNLRALRLRKVALDCCDVRAALEACPGLQTLELWMSHNGTSPKCLDAIRKHGTALRTVVFTRRRTFSYADGKFRAESDREAYVRAAFKFFSDPSRPFTWKLRLRHTEPELQRLAARMHTRFTPPPGCVKPSMALWEQSVLWRRLRE